jgi:hypothetical protein
MTDYADAEGETFFGFFFGKEYQILLFTTLVTFNFPPVTFIFF